MTVAVKKTARTVAAGRRAKAAGEQRVVEEVGTRAGEEVETRAEEAVARRVAAAAATWVVAAEARRAAGKRAAE